MYSEDYSYFSHIFNNLFQNILTWYFYIFVIPCRNFRVKLSEEVVVPFWNGHFQLWKNITAWNDDAHFTPIFWGMYLLLTKKASIKKLIMHSVLENKQLCMIEKQFCMFLFEYQYSNNPGRYASSIVNFLAVSLLKLSSVVVGEKAFIIKT